MRCGPKKKPGSSKKRRTSRGDAKLKSLTGKFRKLKQLCFPWPEIDSVPFLALIVFFVIRGSRVNAMSAMGLKMGFKTI